MICPFSYCPPRCDDRNPACDKKLCKRAEPICVCADGYIIGPNGDCISERQCPNCTSFSIYCYGTTSSHFTTNHFPEQFKGLSQDLDLANPCQSWLAFAVPISDKNEFWCWDIGFRIKIEHTIESLRSFRITNIQMQKSSSSFIYF